MIFKKMTALSLLLILLNQSALADQRYAASTLNAEREQVISQYIADLGKADYQDISGLFKAGGTVVSTSRGYVNAKDFFYGFLPSIGTANTELHQVFVSNIDNNRYAARFHFNFKLKDGEMGDGEYVDEFLFEKDSLLFVNVAMFENLKFSTNN